MNCLVNLGLTASKRVSYAITSLFGLKLHLPCADCCSLVEVRARIM